VNPPERGQEATRGGTYVVDIECVGVPWKSLDEKTQKYLIGRADGDAEREAIPLRLGLSPGTGRVIVIGMWNVDRSTGGVLVEGKSRGWHDGGPQGYKRFDGDEREMLEAFWKTVAGQSRLVTYNGRSFDLPYLMIRSAMLGVAPSRNVLGGTRFAVDPHCDLQEVLTFFGATRSTYSLDYWCRRFGITSPKEDGLDGSLVQTYYDSGRLEEIVQYCCRDVRATAELFTRLRETLLPLYERQRW
jgi:DNA polymerase elongation subunit (family B)